MRDIKFRHEWKHEIAYIDYLAVRQRLLAVCNLDSHATDGKYKIRSLYFDNAVDKALLEKINGISRREKFRIRYYNDNTDRIQLEKKSKLSGLCNKISTPLSKEETELILDGQTDWMKTSERALVRELYLKMTLEGLKPKTIVDYIREPFVYEPGNVRVTLDYDIRTGLHSIDFLNPNCLMIPAGDAGIIMEVKWDEYLPASIQSAVQLTNRHVTAFSKYAACRIYG